MKKGRSTQTNMYFCGKRSTLLKMLIRETWFVEEQQCGVFTSFKMSSFLRLPPHSVLLL